MSNKVLTSLRLPPKMNKILKKIAEIKGVSRNTLVVETLLEWLEKNYIYELNINN